jgi:malate synthase
MIDVLENKVLTPEARAFLDLLHRKFGKNRLELLKRRHDRQLLIDSGEYPKILPDSYAMRSDLSWSIAPIPKDLEKRWVEITGPTDKKMVINALNSGADVFMADFEDANSPTWENIIEGQANLTLAVDKKISYTSSDGKKYQLNEKVAVLFCRPRGWHLIEKHYLVDNEPISASLFDFGLYFFHNAKKLISQGSGPYFYLPKLESHLEARLWNDIFLFAEDALKIPRGTIRATVLIETILAVFEMEEILWELKEHSAGLNAGRWDYIFSIIKKFRKFPIVFPDRNLITMSVPFLRTYADLLVRTCHKRKIHAIGGMSAFIPSRKDPNVNKTAFAQVFEDKQREVSQGFDGTWVAHPDLVQLAQEPFQKRTQLRLNQIRFPLPKIRITPEHLLSFRIDNGRITEQGIRNNIHVALHYLAAWFSGTGAVAIHHLMEDTATAEIARSELWQWLHRPEAVVENLGRLKKEEMQTYFKLEYGELQKTLPEAYAQHLSKAKDLLERFVYEENIPEFLTPAAYEKL